MVPCSSDITCAAVRAISVAGGFERWRLSFQTSLQLSGDAIDHTPDAWEAEILVLHVRSVAGLVKDAMCGSEGAWTLASQATRLAASLQLGAAPQQEASPPAESPPTRSAAPKRAIHVNMAGASLEDVSHVKGICEAATLLFRALRKVQATTARLQGMLALGACQP